jgi:hypothetical protein
MSGSQKCVSYPGVKTPYNPKPYNPGSTGVTGSQKCVSYPGVGTPYKVQPWERWDERSSKVCFIPGGRITL